MVKRWSRVLSIWAAALFLSFTAWGQSSTTGTIEGRVRDQAGAGITGATVTAIASRSPSAVVTDSQGRYTIANLPPGTYKVRAEAPGKSAVSLDEVVVSIGTRSRVDITLVEGQTETVTVTAQAPIVDTKSVTTGGNFKVDKFIDQLPVGRNLAATLTLAPGVESGGGTGAGNYSISGSSGLENSYIVDGVNITSTGYGGIGTYNQVFGSLGTGVTYDFLEEVQVKTGGIDVEYGQATGGVVNTVVKTGSNDLSGSVAIYVGAPVDQYRQASLFVGAVNQDKGSFNDSAAYDLGLSIGGPMVKDKLFYFLAYNPVMAKSTSTIQNIPLPSNISNGNPLLVPFDPTPAYPAAIEGAQTRKRTSDNYAAKLTWYATPNHRLELAAFGDPSDGDMGPQRFSLRNIDFPEGGGNSSISYGANNYSLNYNGVFTPTFFMQAMVARHDGSFDETSQVNKSRYTDQRQLRCFLSPRFCTVDPITLQINQDRSNAATWANGGVGFISTQTDINDQAKIVMTWVAGNNEVKFGGSYDKIQYEDNQEYTGANVPTKITLDGPDPGVGNNTGGYATVASNPCVGGNPLADCYIVVNSRGGITANLRQTNLGALSFVISRGRLYPTPPPTKTDDLAFFLQDTVTFASNWTLKAGLRASQQKIVGAGDFTLPFTQDNVTGQRTNVPESFTSTPYTFDWAFAPRIGLTWDVTGDGRSKAYVNAARYYERVPNDLAIRALSNEVSLRSVTWSNWDLATGIPDINSQTASGAQGGGQTRVESGTKLPYVDEYVLGWQQELGRNVSIELRGIYRQQGRVLEDTQFTTTESTENYYWGPYALGGGGIFSGNVFPFDPVANPPHPFGEYVLANPGENTPAGFPAAVRTYYALEMILNKRFADHWLFYGNMRYASLRGNYEGLYRNDNGQSDPNISSLFDFPDSPLLHGQYVSGPLNTEVPFSLKLYGSYQWDNGFNLGAALNVAAGVPRTPLLAHPNGFYQNAGELPGTNPVYFWYTTSGGCTNADGCLTTGTADKFFADPGVNTGSGFFDFPHLYSSTLATRGQLGQTATLTAVDLNLSWTKQFNRWATFSVGVGVFNVFNTRVITGSDDNIELQSGVTDPDYLTPNAFQTPRLVRVFAKWSF